ncbi:MAG: type II toxin-antitoxin system RelE/ParE family toxin [Synechococcaceae bacterium WB8_1B_136]|nr:type II toxin-antitoxin system RelE/ParE family toxin [Synechococcaceae bacterium WB8_1B_136]
MFEVRQTERFAQWLRDLRDLRARARVQARIERLIGGNPGDVRPIGSGVSELRINYGPGYRVKHCRWLARSRRTADGDQDSALRRR